MGYNHNFKYLIKVFYWVMMFAYLQTEADMVEIIVSIKPYQFYS